MLTGTKIFHSNNKICHSNMTIALKGLWSRLETRSEIKVTFTQNWYVYFCCLLIIFANSFDPDRDRHKASRSSSRFKLFDTLSKIIFEFVIWQSLSKKKGHNSVKILLMNSRFELDLYLTMLNRSINID